MFISSLKAYFRSTLIYIIGFNVFVLIEFGPEMSSRVVGAFYFGVCYSLTFCHSSSFQIDSNFLYATHERHIFSTYIDFETIHCDFGFVLRFAKKKKTRIT